MKSSITGRLNTKLFFRLLRVFMSINIIICVIAGISLAIYCERKALDVLDTLSDAEAPQHSVWMELAGMQVSAVQEHSGSFRVNWPMSDLLSYDVEGATRRFSASTAGGFRGTIRSITYVVDVTTAGVIYEARINIGSFILYFIYAFAALHAFEVIELLSRTLKDRRMVRRTLDPITELARAAQSLNDVNKQLDMEKTILAGRLDGIDGGRLDMRIPVDDLHEELKNVAVAINGMLDRINDSYASQVRFVSDASHELRTPIAVIQGYANLLDRWGKEDEKALAESVSAIKDEAGNMKDLVEQLLFLARGDSNRIVLSQERLELTALLEEVAEESRMFDSGHEFIVGGSGVAILADKGLIKQALRILVDNAIKYTDAGGEIRLTAEYSDGSARLSVADNGIGIKPEILPYVFDRFVRADESRTRATGGAGLGLSIAQWITAKHEGHVEVLSRENVGTRITLVLPAIEGNILRLPQAAGSEPQTAAGH